MVIYQFENIHKTKFNLHNVSVEVTVHSHVLAVEIGELLLLLVKEVK